jgi:hypothetical protein
MGDEDDVVQIIDGLMRDVIKGKLYRAMLDALASAIEEGLPNLAKSVKDQIAIVDGWDGKSSIAQQIIGSVTGSIHGQN